MAKYEVTEATYVPVGPGFRWKKPGQIVTLKAAEAKKLGDSVRKLGDGVAERNTTKPDTPSDTKPDTTPDADAGAESSPEEDSASAAVLETETVREVRADAGKSSPADERAGDETDQRP